MTQPVTIVSDSIADPNYNIYLIDASNNEVTLSLPDSTAGNGLYWQIMRIDVNAGNTVTINTLISGQLIDGLTSVTLAPGIQRWVVSTNGNWA
jgi:hypothetical protein